MSLYKILYTKLYQFTLKTSSADENPEQIASMALSMAIAFNVFTLMLFLKRMGVFAATLFFESYIPAIAIFVITALFNHLLFIRKKAYLRILKNYEGFPHRKRRRDTVIVVMYFVITAILFMVLVA